MLKLKKSTLVWFFLPTAVLMLMFFVLPLLAVVKESFVGGGRAYVDFFSDPVFWRGLQGTLILGTAAPLFSVVIGFFVSNHLSKKTEKQRMSYMFAISLPLTFSGLIVAYGFILVFGRAGFITLLGEKLGLDPAYLSGFIYSPLGRGFAYSYYRIPRAVMIILPAILNFNHDQIVAARTLGASPFKAYLHIMIPQIMPALIAAFCLCSAVSIGAYGTALALVGTQVNILPLQLYSKISDSGSDFPSAAAMSVILMAVCILVMAISEIMFSKRKA